MSLFYVDGLFVERPVNGILAVGAIVAVAIGPNRRDILTVPAEEYVDRFWQTSEHCLLTD
jgi:hypothetical protein